MLRQISSVLSVLLVLILTSTLLADPASGNAQFKEANKRVKATAGEGLKFEADFYRFEFGGKAALAAGGNVKNTTSKKLNGAVYVAFFDKDKNLIAAGNRTGIFLDAGQTLLVVNVLDVPAEQLDQIASYQVTVYEGDKEIGKK